MVNVRFMVPYLHHTSSTMQQPSLTTNPNPHHNTNPSPNPSQVGCCMVLDVWYKQETLKQTCLP